MILRAQPDLKMVLTTLVNKVALLQSATDQKPGPDRASREDIHDC